MFSVNIDKIVSMTIMKENVMMNWYRLLNLS